MINWRITCYSVAAVFILSGCVREEEALSGNQSPPIGDPPPPTPGALQLTVPADMQTEATGLLTTVVIGQASATGGDGNYTITNDAPAGGFAVATTMVTWSVNDGAGAQASAMQSVTVTDTTAPTVTPPADIQTTASGTMTMVNIGTAAVSDLVDPNPIVSNDMPAAGFPAGSTAVVWTATDAYGNAGNATQMVTIAPPTPGPLTLTPPAPITTEATGLNTMVTLGAAMAGGGTAPFTISNNAPAGGFPVGATTVTWAVTDAAMVTATATQLVTITDTTAPAITAPNDVTGDQDAGLGNTMVNLGVAVASDVADPNVAVSNNAPANGYPVGNTTVTWTAQDASGNTATDTHYASGGNRRAV